MDLKTLKKTRSTDFNKISEALEKTANGGRKVDERFWKLQPDKAGNAAAVIRFLPKTENDELPWIRLFSHGFKGPSGLWLFENCRTTLNGDDCPVCEANRVLWESGVEMNKTIVRQRKRKLSFIANIYVVDDPNNPENNGKVFLFKFGKKIFDMIMDKAKPTFEDEEPINIFDLWEGADFKIKMAKADGQFHYNKSTWSDKSALLDGDEKKLLEVVNSQYELAPFVAEDQFKSYEDIKVRLNRVLGSGQTQAGPHRSEPAPEEKAAPAAPSGPISDVDTSEDVESWFQNLEDDN